MSIDLRTSYLGLELRNPIVAAASPLTGNVDRHRRGGTTREIVVIVQLDRLGQLEQREAWVLHAAASCWGRSPNTSGRAKRRN